MSEWVKVEHREEVEVRPLEVGEVVHTLSGPHYANGGDFALRRRVIPSGFEGDESDVPWDDRVHDAEYLN